ncbi:MAG: hypothetical protein FJW30_23140 [Acidobacteria bacterium]|nr:hypothetical protein [Acidobacteriota bacterium]
MNTSGLVSAVVCGGLVWSQTPASRTAEIEQARAERVKQLKVEKNSGLEEGLRLFKDRKYAERFAAGYNGLRVKMGGVTIPRQSRGPSFVSRSKRLVGVAGAAPWFSTTSKVAHQ